ncbi:MAG: hypothetical protein FWG14_13710 [Peptococcaceae bacterium]|nr:hypothetical protein [Peptococcaceae bacterium]
MPGSMIHLLLANKVNPDGSALFHLGNIAPDAVRDRHIKDLTHFRTLEDRHPAMIRLAQETSGDFAEGVLLHMYFDWQWDSIILHQFIDITGDDWIRPYRYELSLAGSHAYHTTSWAKKIWNDMDSLDVSRYGITPCATAADVKELICQSMKWLKENRAMPSLAFPPHLIDTFTTEIALKYRIWRRKAHLVSH